MSNRDVKVLCFQNLSRIRGRQILKIKVDSMLFFYFVVETRNDFEKVKVLDVDVSDLFIVRLPWEMDPEKSLVCYKNSFVLT